MSVLSIVYSFDGILVFGLLFICTCAYFKKVPRLNNWLLSEKKGVWGVFYKGIGASKRSDIGTNQDKHELNASLHLSFQLR